MYEAQFVYRLNGQDDLSHVESRDILAEDLVLDEHRHQVTTGQEFHQHVQESRILERGMQLHQPRRLCICQDVALGADVSQLILLVLGACQRTGLGAVSRLILPFRP